MVMVMMQNPQVKETPVKTMKLKHEITTLSLTTTEEKTQQKDKLYETETPE